MLKLQILFLLNVSYLNSNLAPLLNRQLLIHINIFFKHCKSTFRSTSLPCFTHLAPVFHQLSPSHQKTSPQFSNKQRLTTSKVHKETPTKRGKCSIIHYWTLRYGRKCVCVCVRPYNSQHPPCC